MDYNGLAELIKARRTIRKWQDKPVPEELLVKAVELATWAPNSGNRQIWFFHIILSKEIIGKIADTVQKSANLIASWPESAPYREEMEKYQKISTFFRGAPAAIAVSVSAYQSTADLVLEVREKHDPEAKKIRGWRMTADTKVQTGASGVANLLLILHAMGLGAVWMTGPMQSKGDIEMILGIGPDKDLIAFLPVGYPAEDPRPRPRLPVSQVSKIVR